MWGVICNTQLDTGVHKILKVPKKASLICGAHHGATIHMSLLKYRRVRGHCTSTKIRIKGSSRYGQGVQGIEGLMGFSGSRTGHRINGGGLRNVIIKVVTKLERGSSMGGLSGLGMPRISSRAVAATR
jgi:hypothetical protein